MGSILFGQFLYWYGFWKIVLYWATWVGELRLHVVFVLSQILCLGINFLLIWNCQFEHVYIILLFTIGTEHVFWTSHLHVLQLEDGSSCSGGHRWLTLGSKTLSLPNTKNSSASDWLTRSGLVGMVYPLRLQNEALHEIWYQVYSSLTWLALITLVFLNKPFAWTAPPPPTPLLAQLEQVSLNVVDPHRRQGLIDMSSPSPTPQSVYLAMAALRMEVIVAAIVTFKAVSRGLGLRSGDWWRVHRR